MSRFLESVRKGENRAVGELQVIFADREYVRKLNDEFRRKDKPTDVLSFSLAESKRELSGEIYICVPVAAKQAREYDASLSTELARLFLHGLLHLCGYDHMVALDARRMRERERRYWKQVFPSHPVFPE